MAAGYFERADQTLSQLPSIQPEQASRARLGLWMGKGKLCLIRGYQSVHSYASHLLAALLALARRDFNQTDHLVSLCLQHQPRNLLVLMLSGRLYLQTRRAEQALKAYQQVLQLSPHFGIPSSDPSQRGLQGVMKSALDEGVGMDPRVGLGLSFWLLGDTKKGRSAWMRAVALVSPLTHYGLRPHLLTRSSLVESSKQRSSVPARLDRS
jgi:tetratricopeptide (TPR) repeat protein